MRLLIKQFVAIARLTALEAVRQPICFLLAGTTIAFIALLPVLIMHTFGEGDKLVRDSALALHFVGGLLLGGYAACSSLAHEIKRGTAASVLSKPVGKELFFLAKFCGVALVLGLYSVGCAIGTLLSARMAAEAYTIDWWAGAPFIAAPVLACGLAAAWNFFTHRPFVSRAFGLLIILVVVAFVVSGFFDAQGKMVAFGNAVPWRLAPAGVLVSLATLVLAALAVTLAARLETVPTLAICSVVFLVGLMSDYVLGRHVAENKLAAVLYWLIPNWQHFWVPDALSGDGVIPWAYVVRVGGYAVLYLVGMLCLGVVAFRELEIKAR